MSPSDILPAPFPPPLLLRALEPVGRAHLRLHEEGVDLVPEGGAARPILPDTPLGYEPGLKGDRLTIGGRPYAVPYGKGARALGMLAEGRIRRLGPARGPVPGDHRLMKGPSALHRQWLERYLEPGERPLAFLEIGGEMPIPETILPKASGAAAYYLTEGRQGVVALSEAGDVLHHPLPDRPLRQTSAVGRDEISLGGERWQTTLGNEALYREIGPLSGLPREERLLEAARRSGLAGDWGTAAGHLAVLEPRGIVPLAERLVAARLAKAPLAPDGAPEGAAPEGEDALSEALAALLALPAPGPALLGFVDAWAVDRGDQGGLMARVRARQPAAALPLHRALRALDAKPSEDPTLGALQDLTLAAHLLDAGAHGEAQALLEARLPRLPDEMLMDLLPLHPTDLAEGRGGQALRIRALDLLVEARGEPDIPDPQACLELARLQPLVPRRLRALHEATRDPSIARRSADVLALLEGGGAALSADEAQPPAEPFSNAALDEHMQHPATRSGGVFNAMKLWLGKAQVPDLSAVRTFVEPLKPSTSEAAYNALSDGLLILGLPSSMEAFVSRGARQIGVRAYGGERPFVLIGAAHLDPDSDVSLSPSQLRFALGAELTHLRFKHTRLTASEVWDGVFDMGTQVVDTAISLIGPLGLLGKTLSGYGNLKRVGDMIQGRVDLVRKGAEGAATLVGATRELFPGRGKAAPKEDAPDTREELLAFCRTLQLTADRGGLALSGSLRSSVEGMLLTHPHHLATLAAARRHGLAPLLSRRDGEGRPVEQDLAARIAALFSFYLSEDYRALRPEAEITPPGAP